MLEITIPGGESFDNVSGVFVYSEDCTLILEHSLLSISKWESKWQESFLECIERKEMSVPMFKDYVRCMTIGKEASESTYDMLTEENVKQILEYINAPMTATTINNTNKRRSVKRQKVTSELIYYWMIANGIPFECQKWHLNRLLTLIQVCAAENAPKKKMKRKDVLNSYVEQNAKRKAALNTRG